MEIKIELTHKTAYFLLFEITQAITLAKQHNITTRELHDLGSNIQTQLERLIENGDSINKDLAKRKFFEFCTEIAAHTYLKLPDHLNGVYEKEFADRISFAIGDKIKKSINDFNL